MIQKDDWRIRYGSNDNLKNAKLIYVPEYHKFREGWDHEHCSFCNRCFSELSTVYATRHGYRNDSERSRMDWICPTCFRDLEKIFNFKVEERDYIYNRDQSLKKIGNEDEHSCELCAALISRKRDGQHEYYVVTDEDGEEHILCGRCHAFISKGRQVECFEQFERDVMMYIAKETPEYEAKILAQYEKCSVIGREFTGHGFFANFEVTDKSNSLTEDVPTHLGNLTIAFPGVEVGAGFVLYIENGLITMLEGYIYGDDSWPEKITEYRVIQL